MKAPEDDVHMLHILMLPELICMYCLPIIEESMSIGSLPWLSMDEWMSAVDCLCLKASAVLKVR
jgi:hypothetical protein